MKKIIILGIILCLPISAYATATPSRAVIYADLQATNTNVTYIDNNELVDASHITTLQGNVTTLNNGLTTTNNNLAITDAVVVANSNSITALNGEYNTQSTSITSLNNAVAGNTTSIGVLNGQVSTNTSNIGILGSQVSTNTSNISTNASNINSLNTVVNNQGTVLNNDTSAISTLNNTATNEQNQLNSQQGQINGLDKRVNSLERTQDLVTGKVRVFDTRKWEGDVFVSYDSTRNNVSQAGVEITYKLGSSYEERRQDELEKKLDYLIQEKQKEDNVPSNNAQVYHVTNGIGITSKF